MSKAIAVLGAGSFGTALAFQLARCGHDVRLWGRDAEAQVADSKAGCNRRYLPDFPYPNNLRPVAELASALDGADVWIMGVPSHALRSTLQQCLPFFQSQPLVLACKGLDNGQLPTQVVADVLGESADCAVLSGPTFAKEIAANAPTAVTMASADVAVAERLAALFHGDRFRVYHSDDPIGVALGGALKNPLAIAAGLADGLGFGANTRAALITRGLAEMRRLGVKLGAQSESLMGMAGIGDLVLTCTDDQSRNRRTGLALASGKGADEAIAAIGQVVEGVTAAKEIFLLAESLGVEMPINEQIYRLIYENVAPLEAVQALLGRAPRNEAE